MDGVCVGIALGDGDGAADDGRKDGVDDGDVVGCSFGRNSLCQSCGVGCALGGDCVGGFVGCRVTVFDMSSSSRSCRRLSFCPALLDSPWWFLPIPESPALRFLADKPE